MDFLTDEHNGKIESTQLQIVCHSIEKKVIQQNIQVVTPEHLGDLKNIIVNYYDEIISTIEPEGQRDKARRLIEEGLIFEKDEIRLSLFEGQIEETFGVTNDTLRKLVNSHLLRSEEREKGKYIYELSHDTLVEPVLQAKAWRLMHERAEKEQLVALERERLLEVERRKALAERKKRQAAARLAFASFLLSIVAIVAGVIAIKEKQDSEKAEMEANRLRDEAVKNELLQRQTAEEAQRNYVDLLKEKIQRIEGESKTLSDNAKSYLRAGFKDAARLEQKKLEEMSVEIEKLKKLVQ
jgi:hypothetical protein